MSDENGDLPPGWVTAPLENLAESCLGKMLDRVKNTGVPHPYLRNQNVRWESVDLSDVQEMLFEESESDRFGLRVGDVLVCEGGEPGRAAVWRHDDPRMRFQKAIHRVRCGPALQPDWLVLSLYREAKFGRLLELFTGSGIAHLTGVSLAKVDITVPPLAEQRRIVAKLDDLRARSRRAREALDEVPALLDQLKQSVLAAAFRGDLTADWRAQNPDVEPASVLLDRIRAERRAHWASTGRAKKWKEPQQLSTEDLPELPETWTWASSAEVVKPGTIITYGIVLPGAHIADGVPYVRGGDIEDGQILVEQLLRTTREIAATKGDTELAAGDVLLCIIRHLKVAVVPVGMDGANLTQGTVRLRCSDAIRNHFLAAYLASPIAQSWLKARHFGLAMPRINVEDAREIPIPLPPLAEQDAILATLSRVVPTIRSQARELAIASDELDSLDQAILAKAFRGELVPQDPHDEPADVLLARIKAEASAVDKPPSRRPTKGRAASA